MTKKIMIIVSLLLLPNQSQAATFQTILQKYCIPKNQNGCGNEQKATFIGNSYSNYSSISDNYCQCPYVDMMYNIEERKCEYCPQFSVSANRTSTNCIKVYCTDGAPPVFPTSDVCPEGYYKIVSSDTCSEGYERFRFKNYGV